MTLVSRYSTRIGKISRTLNLLPLCCVPERHSPRVIDFVLCPVASLHRVPTDRSIAHQSTEPSSLVHNTSNSIAITCGREGLQHVSNWTTRFP